VSYSANSPGTGSTYKTTYLVLKRVDPGTFMMGDASHVSSPFHTVTLTKVFYLGVYEVTQQQ